MQDYLMDLSGKNLYTVYLSSKRKRFPPEDLDHLLGRLVEMMVGGSAVVEMLPDLYRLAGLCGDFEEFRSRYEQFIRLSLEREEAQG